MAEAEAEAEAAKGFDGRSKLAKRRFPRPPAPAEPTTLDDSADVQLPKDPVVEESDDFVDPGPIAI